MFDNTTPNQETFSAMKWHVDAVNSQSSVSSFGSRIDVIRQSRALELAVDAKVRNTLSMFKKIKNPSANISDAINALGVLQSGLHGMHRVAGKTAEHKPR